MKRFGVNLLQYQQVENNISTKSIRGFSLGTILSRILGCVRDVLFAGLFGTNIYADVFYAAFKIPNFFRRLFGEGSLSPAVIPVFSEYLHTSAKAETQEFLNIAFTSLLIILAIVFFLGIFFTPVLIKIVAPGFLSNPDKIDLTIDLTRLLFLFLIFVCLAGFLLTISNSLHSFFLPAFAPTILNLSEIFYMLAIAPMLIQGNQIKGLVVSIIVGGGIIFFLQYTNLKKLGWHLKFKFNLSHPGVKKIVFLTLPTMIGLSVDQINVLIDDRFASYFTTGHIQALYLSNRLVQMPLAVFGLAFVSVSLPVMSRAYVKKDMPMFKSSLNYSLRLMIFILFPVMSGFMVIGLPIIRLLFEHGKFDLYGSLMVNDALFYYSLGLPAYAVTKILANAFYSFQNIKTPVKIAILAMIVHALLCIILSRPMGIRGLALATAVASYFNFILLGICLKKYIGNFGIKRILFSGLKSVTTSSIIGILAWYVCGTSKNLFISVPVAILSGVVILILISYILKSEELKPFLSIFLKYNK
jgi:putative peptidoglycan lipid II flippase